MNVLHTGPSRRLPRLIAVLGILAISLGATSKSCKVLQEDNDPNFTVSLRLTDGNGASQTVFDEDATVRMILSVRNNSDREQTLNFVAGNTHDFVVFENEQAIWRWSNTENGSQQASQLVFDANETLEFVQDWPKTDLSGVPAAEGMYEVRAGLQSSDFDTNPRTATENVSELLEFEIRND